MTGRYILALFFTLFSVCAFSQQQAPACLPFTIDSLHFYYKENAVTSGRANRPEVLTGCSINTYDHFGFYNAIDTVSDLKRSVVALIFVSFKNLSWYYSDKDQQVLSVIVYDKAFRCRWLPFDIGDRREKVTEALGNGVEKGDIVYFQKTGCTIAVKIEEGKVSKYITWVCAAPISEINTIHSEVESYLK